MEGVVTRNHPPVKEKALELLLWRQIKMKNVAKYIGATVLFNAYNNFSQNSYIFLINKKAKLLTVIRTIGSHTSPL